MSYIYKLFYLLNGLIPFKKQTFTYFIPAPPMRKSGYREKGFDSLVKQLGSFGFKILDINTTTINDSERLGMWVVITVAPFTMEAFEHDASQFPEEFINIVQEQSQTEALNDTPSTISKAIDLPKENEEEDEIKGIYYID
ncbi:MAG: hypothetical protein NXH75_12345 [Halobacteriovoraceae bacterium]|nr:hypothetical protein [Halobacteriovoraceae bacterium]